MYCRKKVLFLNESDATGVLYFAHQFKIAQETFEEYLGTVGKSWGDYLKEGDLLLPVVHAKADYFSPVQVGDALRIFLSLEKMGTTSFTLGCRFEEGATGKLLGSTAIVHVVIERKTWTKMAIPEFIKDALLSLQEAKDLV